MPSPNSTRPPNPTPSGTDPPAVPLPELTYATFARLTALQRDVLARVAIGDNSFIHPATAAALVRKGLIERYEQPERVGNLSMVINRYSMPVAVHIAWCEYCAATVGDEGASDD